MEKLHGHKLHLATFSTTFCLKYIVAYFFKARTVELEKYSLLGNGYVAGNNRRVVGSGVFCALLAEAI
jgi:hypothetical protein